MREIDEHVFTVEVDVVRFDQDSDRVVLKGFLGAISEIMYKNNLLIIVGDEASISLGISKEELAAVLGSTAVDH